jgi:hypothetical protein
LKLFKKGVIKVTRTATVEYWFKRRKQGGYENSSVILKDPRKMDQTLNAIFTEEDYLQNP